jgi:hypothetical protein
MHLQHIPAGEVKPGQQDELVPGLDAYKTLRCLRRELQPGLRRALVSLQGRRLKPGQLRAHKPNRF